jgi:hypothetical protein
MVGIARADDYGSLMRRIGYSVGLEKLRERFSELVDLYVDRRKFDTADYIELAAEKWQVESGLRERKKKRAEHMADVYSALGLFSLSQLQVQPLAGLDVAAIVTDLASTPATREQAKDAALLHLIIDADGDIFLNVLQCGFEETCSSERLRSLVQHKRERLTSLFPQRDIRERILNQVDFKVQGGGAEAKDNRPFFEQRVYAFAPPSGDSVEISVDLVDKATKTRRKWAENLGLWTDALTTRGQNLIDAIRKLGVSLEDGTIVIWPYEHTLMTLRILPDKLGVTPPSRWDVVTATTASFLNARLSDDASEAARDRAVDLCREIFTRYKAADTLRSKIRAQVPLYVLEPVFAIHCAAETGIISPLPAIIEEERRDPRRRLQLTPIRGADGGIIVN